MRNRIVAAVALAVAFAGVSLAAQSQPAAHRPGEDCRRDESAMDGAEDAVGPPRHLGHLDERRRDRHSDGAARISSRAVSS